jgi:5-dehydro-2-deoxygluconokinase
VAAGVAGFIGFAVGRTNFWEPLFNLRSRHIERETAVAEIACRYWDFAGVFESARTDI